MALARRVPGESVIAPREVPPMRLMQEVMEGVSTPVSVSLRFRAALRFSVADPDGVRIGYATMSRPVRAGNA